MTGQLSSKGSLSFLVGGADGTITTPAPSPIEISPSMKAPKDSLVSKKDSPPPAQAQGPWAAPRPSRMPPTRRRITITASPDQRRDKGGKGESFRFLGLKISGSNEYAGWNASATVGLGAEDLLSQVRGSIEVSPFPPFVLPKRRINGLRW